MSTCMHNSKRNTPKCEFEGIPVGLSCVPCDKHAQHTDRLYLRAVRRASSEGGIQKFQAGFKTSCHSPKVCTEFPRSMLLSVIQESCLQRGGWDPNPWPQEMRVGEVGDRLTGFPCRGLSRRVLA